MPPNWNDIDRCPIWKVLGVIECNDCDTMVQCWGEETQLPEPEDTHPNWNTDDWS